MNNGLRKGIFHHAWLISFQFDQDIARKMDIYPENHREKKTFLMVPMFEFELHT